MIVGEYIYSEEYQDKYYFAKNLKSLFPDLSEKNIYESINSANKNTQNPRKKNKYAEILSGILENFRHDSEKKRI